MDITLFRIRERYDKFLMSFGIFFLFIGILILVLWKEYYATELIGQLCIQIGITILIIDLLIAKLGNRLQQETIKSIFRNILGVPENKKLISELDYIYKPTGYQVIYFEERNDMMYEKNRNKKYNMKVIETRKVIIDVKKENSHYYFDRAMVGEPKKEPKIISLKLNNEELDLTNRRDVVSYKDYSGDRRYFKIVRQLEKGRIYTIEYIAEYPYCMSDLNHKDIKVDFIETRFIELTEQAKIIYKFAFDIKNYDIFLRRKDMSEFKYEPIPKKNFNIIKKNNEIVINECNLKNNDKLVMYYSKK
jgi:hypothetical protein